MAVFTNNDKLAGVFEIYNGRHSNFKAWSTNLSQAEVQQEMRSYTPVRTANLYSWTPFVDASTGSDFLDYSGNGRNWTETGTVTFEDNPPISWRQGKNKRIYIPSVAGPAYDPYVTFMNTNFSRTHTVSAY